MKIERKLQKKSKFRLIELYLVSAFYEHTIQFPKPMSIFWTWYILVEEDFLNLKTSSKYGVHVLLFEIITVKYELFLIFSYILRKSSKFIR